MRAIPASLRFANQRLLVEALLRGESTRAGLSKITGMSQPTVGKIIDELIAAGVVEELGDRAENGGGRPTALGRPGKRVRLSRGKPRFVAVHLGVEDTLVTTLPAALPVAEEWEASFRTPRTAAAWMKRLETVAGELALDNPWGVLVSVPGIVDEREGKVLLSPNLHWSESIDLPELLRQHWKAPVTLVQEVRAVALGELTAEGSPDDFLLVDVGEGLGGAVVTARRLYMGPLPIVGELGHTPVVGNDRACGCGGKGCVETLFAQPGLVESFKDSGARNASWTELVARLRGQSLPTWLGDTLKATGNVIAGALNTHGLRHVVLTGPVLELGDAMADALAREVKQSAMWSRFAEVDFRTAPRRRAAGLALAGIQRYVIPTDWSKRPALPAE